MAADIFGRLREHMEALGKRASALEYEVFHSPPKDMAEFKHRQGQWEEVQHELKELAAVISGKEDEEDQG